MVKKATKNEDQGSCIIPILFAPKFIYKHAIQTEMEIQISVVVSSNTKGIRLPFTVE